MSPRPVTLALVALLLAGHALGTGIAAAADPPTAGGSEPPDGPRIVAVYPNPLLPNDRGEFVVLSVPPHATLGRYALDDGEDVVALPNRSAGGRLVVAWDPDDVPPGVDGTVVPASGRLALANDGDGVRLLVAGQLVDEVTYGRAPSGRLLVRTGSGWTWRPLGATSHPVVRTTDATVTAFVLPDAAGVPRSALEAAGDRIALAGYTFSSRRVAGELCRAVGRGVRVRVLLDDAPVGGIDRREAGILDGLVGCGVRVRVLGGPGARYDFHHAKYAVVDDRAMVLTENWKPAGVGGNDSRGWGAVVDDPAVARALLAVFEADFDAPDAREWAAYRRDRTFEPPDGPPADGRYPGSYPPMRAHVRGVELIVAPDNAEGRLLALLAAANESILIEQVSIGGPDHSLRRATLDASRRGVRVRILLSGAWYVAAENRATVERLNARARREGLPLVARVAQPRSRFGKIHAKGVVIDGRTVVVGSINWNDHALRENREVALVLHGRPVGKYFATVLRSDWRGGRWGLPLGLAGAVLIAGVGAAVYGRRTIRFDPDRERIHVPLATVECRSGSRPGDPSPTGRRPGPWLLVRDSEPADGTGAVSPRTGRRPLARVGRGNADGTRRGRSGR